MFRDNKTAFGQPGTTTFGGFGAAATPGVTPFGAPGMANAGAATAFGKPAAAPGQPVFGSTTATSLFGGTATGTPGGATVPQGGSLFGGAGAGTTFGLSHAAQPAFGGFSSATTAPNIFGASAGTAGTGAAGGGSLFGVVASTSTAPTQVSTSNAVVPFGAAPKPATAFGTLGGFGQTATAPQQTGGSLFGNTSGGMFSTGFGSTAGTTTGAGTPVKFSPLMGTDTMVKNGVQQTINTRHQCITCMKEYESKSLEELRMEDYAAGRRGGGVAVTVPGATNSLVTPGFGATGGVFGAGAGNTTAGSLFGKPATGTTPTGGFSAVTTSANSGFSFSVPGSNLFGGATANKPFGAAAPQPSALFGGGTTTNAFGTQSMGFGGFGQQNQSIGLFGQNKSPFGNAGTTGLTFGAGATQNPAGTAQPAQGTSLFGATKPTTATNPFGTPNAFGVATSTAPPAFGSAFGTGGTGATGGTTSVFGQSFKPTTTSAFSFGQTTQTNTGLGAGLNLGQPSLFGNTAGKPAGTGLGGGVLFGGATSGTSGGGLFGTVTSAGTGLGGGTTFGAGNASMGLGTGGSSLFGGGGTLGGLGSSLGGGTQLGQTMLGGNTGTGLLGSGSTLGGGTNTVQWGTGGTGGLGLSLGNQSGGGLLGSSGTTSFLGNTQYGSGGLGGSGSIGLGSLSGAAGAAPGSGGGAQHVISVSTLPFGDSRLFRDLLPSSAKLDDVLKTTNPAAQKALMSGSQFKVSPHGGNSGSKVKVKPLGASALSKRSLFDGLEEEDASLLTVFSPRTGSKRLTLKSKPPGSTNSDSPPTTSQNSVSTPAAAPSNGPSLSLRARLAGSSASWDKESPRQSIDSGSHWLRKATSNIKESTKGGSSSQLQNSNHHDSPNPNLVNESSSDLENTIADLRTRLDSSGTPIGRPPHRKKDIDLPPDVRSRHNLDPGEDGVDEVDREVSSTIELGHSRDKDEDLRREENDDVEPHPTGITLRRTGYYTIPSLDELATMIEEVECSDGEKKVSVMVENFTIGREGYGNVFFPDSFDVAGLNLDEIVHFRHKEIVVYPGDGDDEDGEEISSPRGLGGTVSKPDTTRKPSVGSGLNRKAQVTLDRVWPIDKVTRAPVTDPDRLAAMNYEGKLQRVCAQMRTRFVEYRPQTGSWVFKVDHFSKYGLSDSDDDDVPPFLPLSAAAPGAVGTNVAAAPGTNVVANGTANKKIKRLPLQTQENGMLSRPGDEQMDQSMTEDASIDISRIDGWPSDGSIHSQGKRFSALNADQEVHENGFQEGGSRAAVTLSPTAQMAHQLGTSTHKVQLMKASFFGEEGDEVDGDLLERRSQPLMAKSRETMEKREGSIEPKPPGDIFRTRFTCRDPTVPSRAQAERGMAKEISHGQFMRPSGPPSTVSSSSVSQFLLPLQETPPPQPVPVPLTSKASSSSSRPSLFPPHPLIHRSKVAVLRHRGRHTKHSDLIQSFLPKVESQSQLLADLGLFMGRTFRSGWGPGMKFYALSSAKIAADSNSTPRKLFAPLVPLSNGRSATDFSGIVVQQLHLLGGTRDSRTFQTWIEPHLWVQLEHSVISDDESMAGNEDNEPNEELEPDLSGPCPKFSPCPGKDTIHAHHDLAHCAAEDGIDPEDPDFQISSYARLVWDLCCALWGRLPELEDDQGEEVFASTHKVTMARRRALSDWLQQAADQMIRGKSRKGKGSAVGQGDEAHTATIFNLLTRRRLLEACEASQKKGDHLLALMLAGGGWNCRAQLRKQLSAWSHVGADEFIGEGRMKLMALKAGALLLPTASARHGTIDCCRGLDWKRAFALHLWYVCSPVSSITDALKEYESAFIDDQRNSDEMSEGKDSSDRTSLYAPQPAPHYLEAEQIRHKMEVGVSGKLPYYDLCFHLLKLYSCRSHSLEALLNTSTHTPDPLDVRLSWLLCESLNALGYSHLSAEALASLHQGMAALLESHGLWHWALFPLMHLENPKRRKSSVLAMLGRHVKLVEIGMMPEEEEAYIQRENFITNRLHIPCSWVYHAKAKLAASQHRHGDTAWCLAKAGLWNECHKVILKHIAADAIINENLDYLRELLAQLAPEERSQTISGWASGGQVFWDYLEVLSEIETLMSRRAKGLQSGLDVSTNEGYCLEKLQPKLSSLCSRLITLPCTSAKERLCQSEISKRIAHVVRALVLTGNRDSLETSPSASRVLAYLVTQLPMPPDYLMQELRHLVEVHLDHVTSTDEDQDDSYVMA